MSYLKYSAIHFKRKKVKTNVTQFRYIECKPFKFIISELQATSQVEESERKVELFRVSLEELLGMVSEQALNKRKPRTAPSALTGM